MGVNAIAARNAMKDFCKGNFVRKQLICYPKCQQGDAPIHILPR